MGLTLRALSRFAARTAPWLLMLVLAAAAFDGWQWYGARRLAAEVAAVDSEEPRDDDPPAVRFARADKLEGRGKLDAAVNAYRELQTDPQLGQAARYNAANVLMRQAATARDAASGGQSLPLIELAKQSYRDVLRSNPSNWEARYNLERAQRLLPEPEDQDSPIGEPRNDAERSDATQRGIAPGLP